LTRSLEKKSAKRRVLLTYGPGALIKSELFKPEVTKHRAISVSPAHRAREARGTALRRAELGCGRSPPWGLLSRAPVASGRVVLFRITALKTMCWLYLNGFYKAWILYSPNVFMITLVLTLMCGTAIMKEIYHMIEQMVNALQNDADYLVE